MSEPNYRPIHTVLEEMVETRSKYFVRGMGTDFRIGFSRYGQYFCQLGEGLRHLPSDPSDWINLNYHVRRRQYGE